MRRRTAMIDRRSANNGMQDVAKILQLMWPKMGHQPRRGYRKKHFRYSITYFRSQSLTAPSFAKKIVIVDTNFDDVAAEIVFKEMDGEIEYVGRVRISPYRMIDIFNDSEKAITSDKFWRILRKFGQAFLPVNLWEQL